MWSETHYIFLNMNYLTVFLFLERTTAALVFLKLKLKINAYFS